MNNDYEKIYNMFVNLEEQQKKMKLEKLRKERKRFIWVILFFIAVIVLSLIYMTCNPNTFENWLKLIGGMYVLGFFVSLITKKL